MLFCAIGIDCRATAVKSILFFALKILRKNGVQIILSKVYEYLTQCGVYFYNI